MAENKLALNISQADQQKLEDAITEGVNDEVSNLRKRGYSKAHISENSFEIEDKVALRFSNNPELVELSSEERRNFVALEKTFTATDFNYGFSDNSSIRESGREQVEVATEEFNAFATKSDLHASLASRAWDNATDIVVPPKGYVPENLRELAQTRGKTLEDVQEIHSDEKALTLTSKTMELEAINTTGDFRQYYSEWFARVEAKIAAKPEAERKALNETFFELVKETTVLLGDKRGVDLVDQPARTHLYRNRLNGPDIKTPEASVSIATATSEAITKGMASLGAVIGLDGERLQDRLALGATNAYHEREWIRQDAAQVAKHAGLDLAKRSGQNEVYRRLDMFYRHARDILTATLDRTQDRQRQKENLTRTMERLSKIARDGGDARFASQPEARTFLADLESRYGAGVVGRIMAGDTSALEQDLPKESERAEFGKALVSVARENDLGRDDRELDRAERLHNATLSRIDRDRENGHDQVFDDGFDL